MPHVRTTAITRVLAPRLLAARLLAASLLAAGLLAAGLLASGCGGNEPTGSIEPVDAPTAEFPSSDDAASARPYETSTTDHSSTPDHTSTPDGPAAADAATTAAVAVTLQRYGTLLGSLAADPAGAPAPGSAARAEWDSVVLPGSPLSVDLLDRLTRRVRDERVVIEPGPDGISYRHSPVEVDPVATTSSGQVVDFRWCGWSPGIGRSLDTGEVVDDAVAHATGTGRLVRVGDAWLLAALDQDDLELLAPGSPDPCPRDPGATAP
jgi:hypothetical protein